MSTLFIIESNETLYEEAVSLIEEYITEKKSSKNNILASDEAFGGSFFKTMDLKGNVVKYIGIIVGLIVVMKAISVILNKEKKRKESEEAEKERRSKYRDGNPSVDRYNQRAQLKTKDFYDAATCLKKLSDDLQYVKQFKADCEDQIDEMQKAYKEREEIINNHGAASSDRSVRAYMAKKKIMIDRRTDQLVKDYMTITTDIKQHCSKMAILVTKCGTASQNKRFKELMSALNSL